MIFYHILFIKFIVMIERDGAKISLWQNTANEFISKNIPGKEFYDVAIAGGGITGITTALLLQNAGKKCIVFESYNLCFGTTGGTTAHLNTLLDSPYTTISKNFGKENAKLVADACKEAIELVKTHIKEYKIDCGFENASAYLFAQTDKQVKELKDIRDSCRDVKLKVVYAKKLPVDIPCKKAIIVQEQAKFHPVKYVHALAKAFEAAGGVILQQCRVENIENNETVEIETSKGNFKSQYFIYATHIPPGINLLHLRCAPYRSYAMAVSLKDKNYPEDLFYDMYDPYHYIRSQKINNTNYLIVGAEDHKTGHVENTNECFIKLEAYVRKYFDVNKIEYKWSSQYFEPADSLPYIGHLPGNEGNILVATGYGGNGMTYSHIAAVTLQNIVLNKEHPYIKLFDPNRIKPVAGFVSFISHNADVVKQFAGKWFGNTKLNEFAELAPDEGKVVKYEGHTIALYKDEKGNLHAVNPTCTHMKCAVTWNTTEQTWDCPCHGARYGMDGVVVTGPANMDLEKIELQTT
jgi:glycine/D-amino acid oxidase-like deaminating enzyme/nitrite reductase/ring-hydroxylating ferredoxin subunit